MRRGFEEFEYEGKIIKWACCEITGCPNNICRGMSDSLCYPHGIEFGAFTKEEFDNDRNRK